MGISGSMRATSNAQKPSFRPFGDDPHRQRADTADEIRIEPPRGTNDLETQISLQNLLPENPQLLLSKPIADTAMNAGTERQMLPGLGPIDDKFIGALDFFFVAISGDIPHHHLVAPGDPAAGDLDVVASGPAHMQHRRLIADNFGNK